MGVIAWHVPLMIGNGLQGTLLGVRGEIEGFSNLEMSIVMSAYFVGFLGASRVVPEMIRRVGHVRVLRPWVLCFGGSYPLSCDPASCRMGRRAGDYRVFVLWGLCDRGKLAEQWGQ